MMTPEANKERIAQLDQDDKEAHEFLEKLAGLIAEYRTKVHMGQVVGALEIVKLRLFHEANRMMVDEKNNLMGGNVRKNPPNQYRKCDLGNWSSTDADGMNGAFSIPLPNRGHVVLANCIVSDGVGLLEYGQEPFEHVSVHIEEYGKQRIPTWEEMCLVKDIFWDEEECVVQYHPPKSSYVNNHPCVLHLWKWLRGGFPVPNPLLVGIKDLGNLEETESITCPQCGRTSHNPNDIEERYCGYCHKWHEDMEKEK